MKNYSDKNMEIKNKLDYINADNSNFVKLSADDVVITGVNEIWDGPLDGTCKWKEQEGYYFYSIDQLRPHVAGEKFPNKFILVELNSKQTEITTREQGIYSDWNSEKITTDEYDKLKSSINSEVIKKTQVKGWFEAVESEKTASKFIDSYFTWKEQKRD